MLGEARLEREVKQRDGSVIPNPEGLRQEYQGCTELTQAFGC